jgi:hypothetical protein
MNVCAVRLDSSQAQPRTAQDLRRVGRQLLVYGKASSPTTCVTLISNPLALLGFDLLNSRTSTAPGHHRAMAASNYRGNAQPMANDPVVTEACASISAAGAISQAKRRNQVLDGLAAVHTARYSLHWSPAPSATAELHRPTGTIIAGHFIDDERFEFKSSGCTLTTD